MVSGPNQILEASLRESKKKKPDWSRPSPSVQKQPIAAIVGLAKFQPRYAKCLPSAKCSKAVPNRKTRVLSKIKGS